MMWEKLVLEIHQVFTCLLFQIRKEIETAKGIDKHFKTRSITHQTVAAVTLWLKKTNKSRTANRFPSKLLPLFLQQNPNILLTSQNESFVHSILFLPILLKGLIPFQRSINVYIKWQIVPAINLHWKTFKWGNKQDLLRWQDVSTSLNFQQNPLQ